MVKNSSTSLKQSNAPPAIRKVVDDMLNRRVQDVDGKPLSGYTVKGGPGTQGICGDCSDGACDGCP